MEMRADLRVVNDQRTPQFGYLRGEIHVVICRGREPTKHYDELCSLRKHLRRGADTLSIVAAVSAYA